MVLPVLFAYFSFCQFWLLIPLAVAFSFVYAASRHEDFLRIWSHAGRVMFWTCFFLGILYAVIYLLS